jgi:hypothetical protein
MFKVVFLCCAIAVVTPLWSQVEPTASGGPVTLDDTRMMTPPPVNGGVYPGSVGAESRSNVISGGIVVTGAYNDNLLPGEGTKISDWNYYIVPTISIDRSTPRQSELLNYNVGATLYQNTTELNGITQSAIAEYRLHLSRYTVVSVRDSFNQNNNLFNQANPFSNPGTSSAGSSPVYVFPFQNQIGNTAEAGIAYQYGKNAMIGGGGGYSLLRYENVSTTPGLDNSNMGQASAFLNRRISRDQYLGAIYEFSRITTEPVATATNTNAGFGYYTKYFTNTISFSIKAGPQHYSTRDQSSGASSKSWTPAVQVSAGYQTVRANVSAGYSRSVSVSPGLIGAYLSNLGYLQAQRQFTRRWNVGVSGTYGDFQNVTPSVSSANPGGHTIVGTASLGYRFNERLRAEGGYSRMHQSYASFGTAAQTYPDSNREYGSITYQFSRPLGR